MPDGMMTNTAEITEHRQQSPDIGELFGALAKAQGAIRNATKDAANPHFKSKYADLASISDACRKPLADNGIAVVQMPHNDGEDIAVTTMLGHSSGQWISSTVKVRPMKYDAQGLGSVVTYLRRYSLAAMAGVAPGDDDDGEAAVGRGNGHATTELRAPSNGPRRAAPQPPADEKPDVADARGRWKRIAIDIGAAKKGETVERVMEAAKDDLAFIRQHAGDEAALSLASKAEERKRDLFGVLASGV